MQPEEQSQVAVDAFLFENFGGANALPGRRDLDEHVIAANACGVILLDNAARLRDGGIGVVRESRIDFRRDAAGHNCQNLLAERDSQPLEGEIGDRLVGGAFAQLVARVLQHAVHNGPILRHLRRGRDQRGVGSRVLGMEFLHRFHVAGIGDDDGVLA